MRKLISTHDLYFLGKLELTYNFFAKMFSSKVNNHYYPKLYDCLEYKTKSTKQLKAWKDTNFGRTYNRYRTF